ncbi:MAG: 4-(cytidine 5'-diphospho)-2-C-methyl-D-erythritol kinase [Anaerovoracaceae bacterium]
MREIKILSFAKINLSIDVPGLLDSGMHQVDMIMHQLSFHDDVQIKFFPDQRGTRGDVEIRVKTNRYYLPVDERNLAHKAAVLILEEYGRNVPAGKLQIDIFKRIPVAAGLAGGSGNGAAVLHGLNVLWKLNLNLERLCDLGAKLGSDVPFCVMGQAKCNFCLPRAIRRDPLACTCARATGTGAQVLPETPIKKSLVIAKPPMGVSTKEVYKGIDQCRIQRRPDNDALAEALKRGSFPEIYGNCINVLENYTLNAYPQVGRLKEIMLKNRRAELVLMSGSGPTVFSVFGNISEAKKECESLRKQGYEAYWTKTIK